MWRTSIRPRGQLLFVNVADVYSSMRLAFICQRVQPLFATVSGMDRRRVQLLLVHAACSQSRHVSLYDTFCANTRPCMIGPSVRDLRANILINGCQVSAPEWASWRSTWTLMSPDRTDSSIIVLLDQSLDRQHNDWSDMMVSIGEAAA